MVAILQERQASSAEAPVHIQTGHIGAGMKIGISSFSSWMLGVGSIIGSMAWLIHGPMLSMAGPLACLTAWVIAGFMALPLVLILAELASMFPNAGGPYVYKYYALKRLIPGAGELLGFLTGWLFWIAMVVGLACMSCGLANVLGSAIWGSPGASPLWFGPAVIVGLFGSTTLMNSVEVRRASAISNLFTFMKIAMAIGFVVLVARAPTTSIGNILSAVSLTGHTDFWTNVSAVLMLALGGFSFLEITACTSSETKDPRRSVPRAIVLTLVSVALIYLSMCLAVSGAACYVLSPDGTTATIPGTAIQATCPSLAAYIGGPFWGVVFTSCVVASIVGCGFTALLGCARVSYSMAKTGLFPEQFSRLHAETKVPTYALWFQFWALCIVGVAANLGSHSGICADAYTFLAETFGFMYSLVAALYGICLISLRYTDRDLPRAFRLGGKGNALAWVLCTFTIAVYGWAAVCCTQTAHQLCGLAILASGIPIYFFYKQRNL